MLYKVDGTEIIPQPTSGQWLNRSPIGNDGNGRPIYPAVREFELQWQLISAADLNSLKTYFDAVGATGTAVVTLPTFQGATYTFFDYSGCVLREPQISEYFNEYTTGVILMVTKIRT